MVDIECDLAALLEHRHLAPVLHGRLVFGTHTDRSHRKDDRKLPGRTPKSQLHGEASA
jgi:hypothetical protein